MYIPFHRGSICRLMIAMTARPKAYVCGRSIAGIMSSNPPEGMGVLLMYLLYVV